MQWYHVQKSESPISITIKSEFRFSKVITDKVIYKINTISIQLKWRSKTYLHGSSNCFTSWWELFLTFDDCPFLAVLFCWYTQNLEENYFFLKKLKKLFFNQTLKSLIICLVNTIWQANNDCEYSTIIKKLCYCSFKNCTWSSLLQTLTWKNSFILQQKVMK